MQSPRAGGWRERTLAGPLLLAAAALLAGAQAPAPRTGPLSVELVFGPEADLDLYVTDPGLETIYFAKPRSRASDGRLEADRRCSSEAPRVERVRFENPPPGRYRVGVDFAEGCGAGRDPVRFRVVVEQRGERSEHSGTIAPGSFLPVVVEFER